MTETARRASLGIGGPLDAEPDPDLVATAFADELAAQLELADAVGIADLGHVAAAVEQGIIPEPVGRRLLGLLLELQDDAGRLEADPDRGDLYTNREAWLQERDPEAAGWLGIGRARREAATVALRLVLRSRLLELASTLLDLGDALLARAELDGQEPFPDYTYLRVAQAGTWGHYLIGVAQPVLRDVARVRQFWPRLDEGPVAVGSGLGSRLSLDRDRLAASLGFRGAVAHTRDATWQADVVLEALGLAAIALVNQARLAEDLLVYSSPAFGLVDVSDRFSRASRALPQKRNPFGLTWIRGLANRAIGAQAAAAAAQRTGTGMPDTRLEALQAVLPTVRSATAGARLLAATVRDLRLDPEAIAARLREGDAAAPDLAEALTERGLPWTAAHAIVARLVRRLRAAGRSLADETPVTVWAALTTELGQLQLTDNAEGIEEVIRAVLDPRAAVRGRLQRGATAPARTEELAAESRQIIAEHRAWLDRRRRAIARRQDRLLRRARRLATGAP
jgi:argininosuccinate lyase